MMVVTYDVDMTSPTGAQRLRRVAKICENYGMRVQNSVFELLIDPAQFVTLKNQLKAVMDAQKDSVRFYRLGNNWQTRVEYLGKPQYVEQGGLLLL